MPVAWLCSVHETWLDPDGRPLPPVGDAAESVWCVTKSPCEAFLLHPPYHPRTRLLIQHTIGVVTMPTDAFSILNRTGICILWRPSRPHSSRARRVGEHASVQADEGVD